MASLIVSRFYDQGVPATGLEAKITIIKQIDKSVVVDQAPMEEVGQGVYQYEFAEYDSSYTYFFLSDGGETLQDSDRYQDAINDFDSYGNKDHWGKTSTSIIVRPEDIATAIWDTEAKKHQKDGTFGQVVQTPASFDNKEILASIQAVKNAAEKAISSIKMPKMLSKDDVKDVVESEIKNIDVEKGVKNALDKYDKKDEWKEQHDNKPFEDLCDALMKQFEGIFEVIGSFGDDLKNFKQETNMEDLVKKLKDMDVQGMIEKIDEVTGKLDQIDKAKDGSLEHIKKMNENFIDFRYQLQNFFSRINAKK